MNLEAAGRWLLVFGLGIAVVGGLLWALGRFFPDLNRLPGTIRIQGSGFTCLFPLLGSIILSILLTVILNLAGRWLNK